MTPIISIIVPVYNVEAYIRDCIDAILVQSFTSFELILVDDGSKDSSGLICEEYSSTNPNIKVYHQINSGVSSARNFGIKKASGEWITFVDGDDLIEQNYLEGLYKPISAQPDIDFVHGGCKNMKKGSIIGYNQKYTNYIGSDSVFLFQNIRGLVISKLFKRELLMKDGELLIQFNPNVKIAEDMIFTIEYINIVKKYAFVEECGYLYRIDNVNSATHVKVKSNYYKELLRCNALIHCTEQFIQNHNIPSQKCVKRLNQRGNDCFRTILYLYFDNYKRKERITLLKQEWYTNKRYYLLYNTSLLRKFLTRFLYYGFFRTFDVICYLIVFLLRM